MTSWSLGTAKAQQIPERRHDVQLLNDTILSIKASFRHLEQSCTALDRKVSKSRTRILGQLMHERQPEHHQAKAPIPRMPWSVPRVDSRPLTRVYAAAKAALEIKALEQMEREELQTSTVESTSDISGESSMSFVDLEALAHLDAEAYVKPEASEASEEAERSSRNSLSVPSSSVRSGAVKPALSRRGALAEAPTVPEAALRTDTALSTPMPSRPTSGSIAGRRELAMVAGTGTANAAVRRVSQRPQSQMRLRVQANRTFSAPRMRYERAEVPSQRQGDAMPVPRTTAIPKPARRPCSANVGKTPRADGRRGIAMPPSRPRSAFAPCRGQRRPCTVPDCEPQARWMTEG